MTGIVHHPTEFTLVDYANGRLDAGRNLVVAAHVERCAKCRAGLRVLDQAGGLLLETLKTVAMEKDALARVWARIEAQGAAPPQQKPGSILDRVEHGKWRWLGPRIQYRAVNLPEADDTRVFMLRAKGGTWLPRHRHTDMEWTCVLEGAFSHQGGRYGAGDFDEADEAVEHHPFVEEGVDCICIVALKGHVKFESWIGRMIQPLVRL